MIKKSFITMDFKLNKSLDKKVCLFFLKDKDFKKRILNFHPKISKMKTNKEIEEYIDNYYSHMQTILEGSLKLMEKEWNYVKKDFIKESLKIFNNHFWPKGNYICYLSIFNCNPRYIDKKSFQIFFNDLEAYRLLLCHEMLHFLFYDYYNKKIKKEIKFNEQKLQKLWIASEVFNAIILQGESFKKITFPLTESGYLEHKKYIKLLKKNWKPIRKAGSFFSIVRSIL